MYSSFAENVNKLWGKHGWLVSLADWGLWDQILPMHIISYWDSFSEKHLKDLDKWAEKYWVKDFILRTSIAWDLDWLVDVMPTYRDIVREDVQRHLEEICSELWDFELREYAKNEWVDFRPEDCTISISPQIPGISSTITEHPNAIGESHLMVDSLDNHNHYAKDYNGKDIPEHISKMLSKVRKIVWNDEYSFQIESSDTEWGSLHIYQLRNFARKNPLETYKWKLLTQDSFAESRMFWSTENKKWENFWLLPIVAMNHLSTEDWVLKVSSHLDDQIEKIVYQSGLYETYLQSRESWMRDFNQPQWMNIYLGASSSPALSHMHTRYIQSVLKNDWAAYLTSRWNMNNSWPLELPVCMWIQKIRLTFEPWKKPYWLNC